MNPRSSRRAEPAPVPVAVAMLEAGEYRLTAPDGREGTVRYLGWRKRYGHQWRLRSPLLAGTPEQDIRLGSRREAIAFFARLCQRP